MEWPVRFLPDGTTSGLEESAIESLIDDYSNMEETTSTDCSLMKKREEMDVIEMEEEADSSKIHKRLCQNIAI